METRKQPVSPEIALANDVFDQFCTASTLKTILGYHRHLCELLRIKPTAFPQFYPKLKSKLRSWKATALWSKFDKRASHKCYNRGKACPNTRVLIIGCGPCGLRTAIEAQLLGAKVVVVEKRDRFSRNNVLHLWPFVIADLKSLGAKKFFGKFCAGSIDHISIRQLQCILLKVALILGVEIHEGVGFEGLVPPPADQSGEKVGWRAEIKPSDHPVSQYEFDVLIGADGKRNTLEGFKRKEFRGKLAIAITANFINRHSEAEARVEEISGVAFIFNQKFFKDLYSATGIDLENIVYYKDETHYFVMTAKKHSLIDKGVILQDHSDTAKLLALENVDKNALQNYAREAADFSTNYMLPQLEFAVNHYGQPDVAMFDFTSMFAAENASRVVERNGYRLLQILVGDSLLEPFWPTGSGCARGFLSSMDACWAIKGWGGGQVTPLDVIAERESIYRILGQTTPENLHRDYNGYTLDPHTRYPNLNPRAVIGLQVRGLYDTDDPASIEQPLPALASNDAPKKRRRRDSQVHPDTLLLWLKRQVALYDVKVENVTDSFKNGLVLCAIIHRYRPDLIDFHSLSPDDIAKNNQLAFDTLERELGVPPVMTGQEMEQCDVPDKLTMLSYLSQIYDTFRGEIPHIKHPKLELDPEEEKPPPSRTLQLRQLNTEKKVALLSKLTSHNAHSHHPHHAHTHRKRSSADRDTSARSGNTGEHRHDFLRRRPNKRRSMDRDKMVATEEEQQRRSEELSRLRMERIIRRQYLRHLQTQQFYKSMQMLQGNAKHDKDDEPYEDYSLFVYRLTAPDFQDRVKDLEKKLFYPERETRGAGEGKTGEKDEDFSGRVKSLEEKLRGSKPTEKKPKDLYRAIGKIEKTDWNVKKLEKKIEENKMGHAPKHDRPESVPKWNKQQFDDKFQLVQQKLQRRGPVKDTNDRYAQIDTKLLEIGRKLKEGNVLDVGPRGSNKVSAMAEQFKMKNQDADLPPVQKSNSRAAIVLPAQGGSETCHFCNKRVYLMERLSAEGKFFHRGCFRCEYCGTGLRQNNYLFDREGRHGSRFYCAQHFGMHGKLRMRRKSEELQSGPFKENVPLTQKSPTKTPEKAKSLCETIKLDSSRDGVDMRATPERIEFENHAGATSDVEEAPSEMDEDEWTDRNFGASAAEVSSDSASEMSDSEDEMPNEVFEEAIQQPLTADETRRLAESWQRRYSKNPSKVSPQNENNKMEDKNDVQNSADRSDSEVPAEKSNNIVNSDAKIKENVKDDDGDEDDSESYEYDESDEELSYHEYESDDDGSDTATEGDEQNDADKKAREMRRQEVCLEVPQRPPRSRHDSDTNTGSDTEVASDYSTESDSEEEEEEEDEIENSATEISTDSEFEHDGTTPTTHTIPSILIDNPGLFHRNAPEEPKKVQVRSGHINGTVKHQTPTIQNARNARAGGVRLEISPLRPEGESKSASLTNLTSGNNIVNNKNNNNITSQKPLFTPTPLINPRKGDYLLNRTQSTEGIASKLSLQLKKKYLLGPSDIAGSVKKSGSSSTLDSKVKSFVDVISEHQKLLNPAPEPSPTMQAFLQGTSNLRVPSNATNPMSPPSPTSLNAPTKLTSSLSPLTSVVKNPKEIPQLNDSFEHVCGLGKKEETLANVCNLDQKNFEHICGLGKKDESQSALEIDNFEHVCGLGNQQNSSSPQDSVDNSKKSADNLVSKDISSMNGICADELKENIKNENDFVDRQDKKTGLTEESLESKLNSEETKILQEEHDDDLDCRPRSPAHETSIVVPDISWKSTHKSEDIESDSLSSSNESCLEDGDSEDDHRSKTPSPVMIRERTPPRVEIHNSSGELMEEECVHEEVQVPAKANPDTTGIIDEKQSVPVFPSDVPGKEREVNSKPMRSVEPLVIENKRASITSDRSSPSTPPSTKGEESESFHHEATMAILTETELSDWAHDGDAVVSEDLEDVEFNINPEFVTIRRHRKTKTSRNNSRGNSATTFAKIARGEDFGDFDEDPGHVCGKEKSYCADDSKTSSSILSNIENIEYMDTGEEEDDEECSDTEELLDAKNKILLRNNGYVQFVDIDDDVATPIAESPQQLVPAPVLPTFIVSECEDRSADQCDSPEIFEAVNREIIVASAGEEEESSLQPEGTTTEETTTTSELATVKDNLGQDDSDVFFTPKQESSDHDLVTSPSDDLQGQEYDEYVKRLQGRISPFHNVRDSIDVRKSRRKIGNGKVGEYSKPQECISEETIPEIKREKNISCAASPINSFNSPSTSRKLEEISRERSKQKDLIHEMVLAKHMSQRKSSQERKQRKSKGPQTPPPSIPPPSMSTAALPVCISPSIVTPPSVPPSGIPTSSIQSPCTLPLTVPLSSVPSSNIPMSNKPPTSIPPSGVLESNSPPSTLTSSNIPPSIPPSSLTPSSVSSSQFSSGDTYQTPLTSSSDGSQKESVVVLETPSLALPVIEVDVSASSHSIHENLEVPFVDDSVLVTEETEQFFTPLTSFKKEPNQRQRPVSVHSSFRDEQKPVKYSQKYSPLPDTPLTNPEAFSLPDIRKALFKTPDELLKTPIAPPRVRNEQTRDCEQARVEARERARLKSDEELGLSPEDYILSLKQRTGRRPGLERSLSQPDEAATARVRRERSERIDKLTQLGGGPSMSGCNSLQNVQTSLTSTASPNSSIASPPLSTPHSKAKFYLDPNHSSTSAETSLSSKEHKKSKDPERRKSIIQAVSDFFHKKKDTSATPSPPKTPTTSASTGVNSKEKFRFKFSRSKDKSRYAYSSCSDDSDDSPGKANGGTRSKSETLPPPIPPLPINYMPSGSNSSGRHGISAPRASAEDSYSEPDDDSRATAVSTPTHESSAGSLNRRQSRMHRRIARQAHLKRLRMAQEIQRQLEEVEVKQRELEQRGVKVEKALRGEGVDEVEAVDEAELLREWFELVRERSELRRYEHELLVRAEELQLEDRHALLQQELRDRMAHDDLDKTSEDVAKEGQILGEMLEIVERRDSLIALLEEDRQRYQEEDRDFEAQMLAKGLRLTPLRKESNV